MVRYNFKNIILNNLDFFRVFCYISPGWTLQLEMRMRPSHWNLWPVLRLWNIPSGFRVRRRKMFGCPQTWLIKTKGVPRSRNLQVTIPFRFLDKNLQLHFFQLIFNMVHMFFDKTSSLFLPPRLWPAQRSCSWKEKKKMRTQRERERRPERPKVPRQEARRISANQSTAPSAGCLQSRVSPSKVRRKSCPVDRQSHL